MNSFPPFCITSAQYLPTRLDFRMGVSHSLASRMFSVNVIILLESDTGAAGYGEGVPRQYVTGETPDTVMSALDNMLGDVRGAVISSPETLIGFLEGFGSSAAGKKNPSALCSLELALLDLAGKHWNLPLSDLLGFSHPADSLYYSMVVPLLPDDDIARFLEPARGYGFRHVKVKIGATDPAARVRSVQAVLGPDVEIRADANCAWNRENAPRLVEELTGLGVVSIEQPLPAEDLEGMAGLRKSGKIEVTLDESVSNPEDVHLAADARACDIVNVRISKCGGVLGALRVVKAAGDRGLEVQLGAQVGESCILSAAGACLAAGTMSFRWLEGCFGEHLLVRDFCGVDLRFGQSGFVRPPSQPGLGVPIDRERIGEAHAAFLAARESASS